MVCALALSALSVACGKSRTSERLTRTEISAPLKFPKGFLWGTATAAEQLEATTASDWAELIRKSYAGEGKAVTGAAIKDLHLWPATVIAQKTAHNEKFAEDVALMKSMGNNAYRFSIA